MNVQVLVKEILRKGGTESYWFDWFFACELRQNVRILSFYKWLKSEGTYKGLNLQSSMNGWWLSLPRNVKAHPVKIQNVSPIFQPNCIEATKSAGIPTIDIRNSEMLRLNNNRLKSVWSWKFGNWLYCICQQENRKFELKTYLLFHDYGREIWQQNWQVHQRSQQMPSRRSKQWKPIQ